MNCKSIRYQTKIIELVLPILSNYLTFKSIQIHSNLFNFHLISKLENIQNNEVSQHSYLLKNKAIDFNSVLMMNLFDLSFRKYLLEYLIDKL